MPGDTSLIESSERCEESDVECGGLKDQLEEAQGRLQSISQEKDAKISQLTGQLKEGQGRLQDVSQETDATIDRLKGQLKEAQGRGNGKYRMQTTPCPASS